MTEITLVDSYGDHWTFLVPVPGVFKKSRRGLIEMWVYVKAGPECIFKYYKQIPLPVFTEWWP